MRDIIGGGGALHQENTRTVHETAASRGRSGKIVAFFSCGGGTRSAAAPAARAQGLIMPTVAGVLETALHVADLDVAQRFYQALFGFERMVSDHRFCALAVTGRAQVLLLFKQGGTGTPSVIPGGIIPAHDGAGRLHLAFAIDAAELEPWRRKLAAQGVALESTVHWERGGTSLYFRDPDQHLLELVTPGCWPNY